MTTLIPEKGIAAAAAAMGKKPKANKKARVAPRRANVAPAKAKSAHKATSAKKAPKGRTKPEVAKPKAARGGSKSAQILDLLKRPGGAVGIFRWVFPLACGAETSVHGPVVDGHGEERALWKQRY